MIRTLTVTCILLTIGCTQSPLNFQYNPATPKQVSEIQRANETVDAKADGPCMVQVARNGSFQVFAVSNGKLRMFSDAFDHYSEFDSGTIAQVIDGVESSYQPRIKDSATVRSDTLVNPFELARGTKLLPSFAGWRSHYHGDRDYSAYVAASRGGALYIRRSVESRGWAKIQDGKIVRIYYEIDKKTVDTEVDYAGTPYPEKITIQQDGANEVFELNWSFAPPDYLFDPATLGKVDPETLELKESSE